MASSHIPGIFSVFLFKGCQSPLLILTITRENNFLMMYPHMGFQGPICIGAAGGDLDARVQRTKKGS
jgi:hypothetical protein